MIVLAALYALATFVLVAHGLRIGGLALARLRTEAHDPAPPPETWPLVCVQLPVYNEPTVVERAVEAVGALDYPALEIQVLDDSTDATTERAARAVRRLQAQGLQAVHLRRDSREGFKAGALASGLARTEADLVAVFDADFVPQPSALRWLVAPLLADSTLAFAQARWAHLNRDASALTRAQGALLDVHFAIEQTGRGRTGRFLPFNGTAGVWRREAIEAAGGWSGGTLAEDLDLSLRAWTRGWSGTFVESTAIPAELPGDLGAWRRQQARWAEGMAGVTRIHTQRLLRAPHPLDKRLRALFALTAPMAYPALLAMLLLHPVLAAAHALSVGPSEAFFSALGLGWLGLIGAILAHAVAQRTVRPGAPARGKLVDLALGLAAPVTLAVTGTQAMARGLAGRRTAFARTPKGGLREATPVSRADAALAAYVMAGSVVMAALGAWIALAFQIAFAVTLGASVWETFREREARETVPLPASA
ncbi:MAG: glycosyltransferase [Bacteroidota bacterium]